MGRKRMKGCKYQRVSQQQKYIFLKLCITQQQSIHEAAFNAGIQYSTAKTILFFHKKNYKNYSSYHVAGPDRQSQASAQQASWKAITIDLEGQSSERQPIEIVVNSKVKIKKQRKDLLKNEFQVEDEEEDNPIKIEHESRQHIKFSTVEVKKEAERELELEYLTMKMEVESLEQESNGYKQMQE